MRKVKQPIQTKDDWDEIEEFITVANNWKKMEKEEDREKSQRKKRLPRK